MTFEAPLDQTKMGATILVACIVRTLTESDTSFQPRFLDHLSQTYAEVRNHADSDCLEMLTWAREMLETGDYAPQRDS